MWSPSPNARSGVCPQTTKRIAPLTLDYFSPRSTCTLRKIHDTALKVDKYFVFVSDSVDSVSFTSIGCYFPGTGLIPSLEGQDPRLDGGNYKVRTDAIGKCASVAKQRGYKVFALYDGGKCLSSSNAHMTFQTYGKSYHCKRNGRGGRLGNHVYAIGGIKGMIMFFFFFDL